MTYLADFETMKQRPHAKGKLPGCADVVARALAANDFDFAVRAKQHEIECASHVGMHQHAVVACAELLDLWPRLADLPLEDGTKRNLVTSFKHGSESALELPEIPIATVRSLFGTLGSFLERFSMPQVVLWTLEARLAFVEGDRPRMQRWMERVIPTFPTRNRFRECSDCLGCTLADFAKYMEHEASADEIEALTTAVTAMPPYQPCYVADRRVPAHLAVAYVRQGRVAEARIHVAKALRAASTTGSGWLEARAAGLEVAAASGDGAWCAEIVAGTTSELAGLEEPYGQLAAYVALGRALRALERDDTSARTEAIQLARRVDQRLDRPRHLRETEAAFAK